MRCAGTTVGVLRFWVLRIGSEVTAPRADMHRTQNLERRTSEPQSSSFYLMMRMLLMLPMLAQDHFHSILERELAFLEGDFFDLFGF